MKTSSLLLTILILCLFASANSRAETSSKTLATGSSNASKGTIKLLAVQTAATGTWAPQETAGIYLLTLKQVHPRVVVFSDRPQRISTTVTIDEAIKLFWSNKSPPNVALEFFVDGKQRIIPLELSSPHHEPDTKTVSYQAQFLPALSTGLGHLKPGLSVDIPASFGNPTIYIDADGCVPDSAFGGCGDTGV